MDFSSCWISYRAFLIRYVIKRVLYKGFDVVENAIKDKKNKTESHEPESLADRYKK